MEHSGSHDDHSGEVLSPVAFVAATERAFARCPKLSGLHLVSAEAAHGFLTARFEGPVGDFRGPYGVVVRLPVTGQDDLWATYAGLEGSVNDWCHAAVALRALDAHLSSRRENRGYSPDGVWWLFDESPGQEPHESSSMS
jgi:hypothetical protein